MPIFNANIIVGCSYCGKPLNEGDKFCSRECKSKNQELKIDYVCNGCGKTFKKWPCMKRKSNYCSINCYWNSTRLKKIRICKVCGKEFVAKNNLITKGFGIFCSRECQHKTYPKKIKKTCPQCKKTFLIPPSWDSVRTFSSKKCQDDSMRDYVACICRCCKKKFEIPRSDLNRGRGTYCSRRCFITYNGPSLLELKMEKALILSKIKFEREVKFKRFHADFLLEEYKTVIECDGEYWHLRPKTIDRDKRKDILLKSLGYKVLRFTGNKLDKLNVNKLSKILTRSFKSFNR